MVVVIAIESLSISQAKKLSAMLPEEVEVIHKPFHEAVLLLSTKYRGFYVSYDWIANDMQRFEEAEPEHTMQHHYCSQLQILRSLGIMTVAIRPAEEVGNANSVGEFYAGMLGVPTFYVADFEKIPEEVGRIIALLEKEEQQEEQNGFL